MSYIEIQAEKVLIAIEEKQNKLRSIEEVAKENAIQNTMEEKIGWWFNWRLMSREEATIDVNKWWNTSQSLRGVNGSLSRLKKLEILAKTSQKIGNGVVHLSKEDNIFIFGEYCV